MAIKDNIAELKTKKFWIAINAEFMGTMLLVLIACGSCQHDASVLSIALSFGLTVGTVVWTIAHVSGGHINPAVTVAFLITRKITLVRALLYILAQCGGAVAGAYTLQMASGPFVPNLGTSTPGNDHIPGVGVFMVEMFITFVLVFVVFATCDGLRKGFNGSGPLTIGLSVTIGHLWAVKITGAGTNPARVFGPALISNTWTSHWAYWVGPIVGGIAAALTYDLTFAVNANRAKLRAFFTRSDYDDSQFDENGERDDNTHNDTVMEIMDKKHTSRK